MQMHLILVLKQFSRGISDRPLLLMNQSGWKLLQY
jgi:hypothetical protein